MFRGANSMDRKMFFKLVESEFFTVKEGHSIATEGFVDFDLGETELVRLMVDTGSRKELFDFLVLEKEKDDWCFLSEEFAGCFMQMLSANQSVNGIDSVSIDQVESMYYQLIEGMLEVTAGVQFDPEKAMAVYVGHMSRLRNLLVSIMDIEELKTHDL
jgi:hypothetical protein